MSIRQSGNSAGRPPSIVSIEAELQKLLNLVIKGKFNQLIEETEDMPVGRKIALNMVLKAVADNECSPLSGLWSNWTASPHRH